MTKDNSTGKPKDFYSRGQQMFDSLNLPDDDDDTQSYTSDVALAEAYRCGYEAAKAEQQAEPVAWMSSDRAWMWSDYSKALAAVAHIPRLTLIPLYTTPPQQQPEQVDCPRCGHVCSQREWVGLEAEDLAQIDTDEFWQVGNHMAIAMAVEAKLREKNT